MTSVPPGIASPDEMKTRLGTLKFFDGFPDRPTVEKLFDNLDFQRAVQAYLLGLAPVSQAANRKGILEVGPVNTTVPIYEQMMTPQSIFSPPTITLPTRGYGSTSTTALWFSKSPQRSLV